MAVHRSDRRFRRFYNLQFFDLESGFHIYKFPTSRRRHIGLGNFDLPQKAGQMIFTLFRRHPIFSGGDLNRQRHIEFNRRFHFAFDNFNRFFDFRIRRFKQ
jgi:hypothetical protein